MVYDPPYHQSSNFHLDCIAEMLRLHHGKLPGIFFIDRHIVIGCRIHSVVGPFYKIIPALRAVVKIAVPVIIIDCKAQNDCVAVSEMVSDLSASKQ